jgi:hypothetical protein
MPAEKIEEAPASSETSVAPLSGVYEPGVEPEPAVMSDKATTQAASVTVVIAGQVTVGVVVPPRPTVAVVVVVSVGVAFTPPNSMTTQ